MPALTKKRPRILLKLFGVLALFILTSGAGTATYFHYAPPGQSCGSCHEMHTHIDQWASSAHKGFHCRNCHGGTLTLDMAELSQHVRRLVTHLARSVPEEIHLSSAQVAAIDRNCAACHKDQSDRWKSGGHSATFSAIFLNDKQNHRERFNGDCLRCHGMFFDGTTDDVVTPMNVTGPWKLRRPELAQTPVTPCLTCHQMHRAKGTPAAGLYIRHEKSYFSAELLPTPVVIRDGKPLKVSPDPRQRLCVQCHAPDASHNALTNDDRTPTGVHEGLSCLDCHDSHGTATLKETCDKCHAGKTIQSPQKKVHDRSSSQTAMR